MAECAGTRSVPFGQLSVDGWILYENVAASWAATVRCAVRSGLQERLHADFVGRLWDTEWLIMSLSQQKNVDRLSGRDIFELQVHQFAPEGTEK
jgi:hypothetical protein